MTRPDVSKPTLSVFDVGPSVFYLLREESDGYRPVWVSDNIRRIFGFDPAEVLRAGWWVERLHPDDREAALVASGGLAAKDVVAHEYRFLDASREYRWVRDELRRLPDAPDRSEILGTWTDLTSERARSDAERERYVEAILTHATHIVTVIGPDGIIRYESSSVEPVLGWTPDELVGRVAFELVHPDDVASTAAAFEAVVTDPMASRVIEFRFRHKNGGWRCLRGRGNNLLHDPLVSGVVFNGWDVTEEKRLEAELRQAQKVELLGQLAGGVAHDFNNILAAIRMNVEMALDSAGEGALAEDLREVLGSVDRGSDLTKRLLAFGRRKDSEVRTLDLNEVVTSVRPLLDRLVRGSTTLEVELADRELRFEGDEAEVHQIVMNLVVNARDAMGEGGGAVRVLTDTVSLGDGQPGAYTNSSHRGTFAVLTVEDEGPGIPEEIRDRIFDPFFTTKPEGEGTGLGLATVYRNVSRMKGFVELAPPQGKGARFDVHLPVEGSA